MQNLLHQHFTQDGRIFILCLFFFLYILNYVCWNTLWEKGLFVTSQRAPPLPSPLSHGTVFFPLSKMQKETQGSSGLFVGGCKQMLLHWCPKWKLATIWVFKQCFEFFFASKHCFSEKYLLMNFEINCDRQTKFVFELTRSVRHWPDTTLQSICLFLEILHHRQISQWLITNNCL